MALRDQPYLPLYVQDYLTDEKLNMCSASSQGIYIKVMCIMHKSDEYGVILLKQKDKQNGKQINNFAYKLARLLPFRIDEIEAALSELLEENVLQIEGDKLIQKRMVRDNSISIIRSEAGKKGGVKTQTFAKAKNKANNEYENENENEDINSINIVFDEFWNLYDKKVAKAKCEPKWNKLKDSEREDIMRTLPKFLKSIKDKQFQPYPYTYLNQRRWEDEIQEDDDMSEFKKKLKQANGYPS